MDVYVYLDTDNYHYEVFKTLESAKSFGTEEWGDADVWEEDRSSWTLGEYVRIVKKTIRD